MTRYEQEMYENHIPRAVKALERIASNLDAIKNIIISDPGDEIEHIYSKTPISVLQSMQDGMLDKNQNLPDDYKMD